jgi:hypothetical protein
MTEPDELSASKITLKSSDMILYLCTMSLKVLGSSISLTTGLLTAPSNKSHGSFGSEPIFKQQSKRLKNGNKSSTIIIGSSL